MSEKAPGMDGASGSHRHHQRLDSDVFSDGFTLFQMCPRIARCEVVSSALLFRVQDRCLELGLLLHR